MALRDVNMRDREMENPTLLFERLDQRKEFARMLEMLNDPELHAMLRTHMAMTSFPWKIDEFQPYQDWLAAVEGARDSSEDVSK